MRTCMFGRGAVFLFGAAAAGEKYTDEQKGDFCMSCEQASIFLLTRPMNRQEQ